MVGPEIVGNGRVDAVAAIDFAPGLDRLLLDPAVRGAVVSIGDAAFDLGGTIGLLRRHGAFSAEVADRIRDAGVATLENELDALLAYETPGGQAVAGGALVTTAEGDQLFFVGVGAADIDALI